MRGSTAEQVIILRVRSINKTAWIYKNIFPINIDFKRQEIVMFMSTNPMCAHRITIEQHVRISIAHDVKPPVGKGDAFEGMDSRSSCGGGPSSLILAAEPQ